MCNASLIVDMRVVGIICALLTTVRATCEDSCWVPEPGEIVQDAADALGVDLDTFERWNPDLKNPDRIFPEDEYKVSSVGPLHNAVWLTTGSTRFLSLRKTSASGYETSEGWAERSSPTSAERGRTLKTTFTTSPTAASEQTLANSPSQFSATLQTSSPNIVSSTLEAANSHTTTTPGSVEDPKPSPPYGGLVDGLPLLCNAKNDGRFAMDGTELQKLRFDFCTKYGGKVIPREGFTLERADPNREFTVYNMWAAPLPGCDSPHIFVPPFENCEDRFHQLLDECKENEGTGGVWIFNCAAWGYQPLHKRSRPDGFELSWGLEYVENFLEGTSK